MSKIFIIDEWLWSDLNGDNGKQKQKEAHYFLNILYERCDKIAVAKCSKFQEKEWTFSKDAGENIIKRNIARLYFGMIRFNFLKYEEVDIEGTEDVNLERILEDIDPNDVYLVKTHYKTNALIITTDNNLMDALQSKGIPCKLRDIFLQTYL